MMTTRPYRPVRELEAAIARGELDFALAHAKEVARERGGPLDLGLALGLLTLVAAQQREAYDAWALRWLARWLAEADEPTTATAAALAVSLAEMPADPPAAASAIRQAARLR
jgi:hypothetical protein